ncbi:MAG: 5'/3'-nucleotidase SurE [Candidatus Omnitrophota bacterium]
MHILLTNDDGIYAPGILALHAQLAKIAKVTVVAPDSERSSIGHAITLAHPLFARKINRQKKFFGYGLSGTPADCVKFAVGVLLKRKPDLVISGINLGPNDGCSVFYSGTVAGAREGAISGIPSIAVSLGTFTNPTFDAAARFTAKLAKIVIKNKLPKNTFLNVNVPNQKMSAIKGVRIARQGKVPIHGQFKKNTDPSGRAHYWMFGEVRGIEKNLDVDTYALSKNFVSVVPIQCDSTDHGFLPQLKSWKF